MLLKKYVFINSEEGSDVLTLKIVNGFTGDKTKEALDVQNEWTPRSDGKDKVYFLPGCIVPRFKVREFFTVTIKPSKATALFINGDTLEGGESTFVHYKNTYVTDFPTIKTFLLSLNQSHFYGIVESLYNSDRLAGVHVGSRLWREDSYSKRFTKTSVDFNDCLSDFNKYTHKYNAQNTECQLYGVNKNNELGLILANCVIYQDNSIIPHLNDGALVIDEAKYEELRAYAEADKENLILLMELMANSDYKQSIVHLTFLLKEYGPNMLNLKESHHVNFKAMLNFLGFTPATIASLSVMRMTKVLQDHKVFTKANVARLSMLYAGEHINYSDPDLTMWQEGLSLKPEEFKNLD